MSLNSVSSSEFYGKVNSGYRQNQISKEPAQDIFGSSFKAGRQDQEPTVGSSTTVQMNYRYGKVASELLLQSSGRVNVRAFMECAVRYISYEESDLSRVCVEEGYSLKAQVDLTGHRVYIEQKFEDGSYQAYEVNPLLAAEDTKNPIEQMAKDAWEEARNLFNGGMFTEALDKAEEETSSGDTLTSWSAFEKLLSEFSEYVEQRIKDGPPKIQTGGAAFSEEEWDRLLRKIDKDIDAYKEELRERIRKQQEAAALNKAKDGEGDSEAEEAVSELAANEAAAAGVSAPKTSESISFGPGLSENEALEGLTNQPQRGSGFLARLSGTKKAPYSYLADETGVIVYNGVTFYCDDKKQQICLGDTSNSKDVINIPLSKGGCLRVNRDNIGDLAKAIGMFSAEDVGRILRAISQDSRLKGMEQEIEDMVMAIKK